jgi:pimeloyl-ACP methyl ester carboxylesterase
VPHEMRDLIVLLPGIMGSVLSKDGKPVWGFSPGAMARGLFTGGLSITRSLALGGDDPERATLDDGVTADALLPDLHLIPRFWKIDGYRFVSDTILGAFDVRDGENFFPFAYDWRRDNRASARQLQRKTHDWLKAWRQRSPNAKLILIAHSMGGLVSRYFLDVLGGWRETKALITFGTPYRGSLNALDTLSNGIRKGPLPLGHLTEFCRTCTSIYQLLPIYPCYAVAGGPLERVGDVSGIPNVDAARAREAQAFHQEIINAVNQNLKDPEYLADRYRVFPIAGHMQSTLQSARVDAGRVMLEALYEGKDMSGDGTVPRISAVPHEYSKADNTTFAAMKHGSLQNTPALLEHVEGVVTGLDLDLGKFLAPDRRVALSLQVEDVYFDDEPIVAGIDAGEDRLRLEATIEDAVTGRKVVTRPLRDLRDGTYTVDCGVLPEGSYRIGVSGDETAVASIADSFGVTPRVS